MNAVNIMPEVIRLGPLGWVPNNPRLPVLFYHDAIPSDGIEHAIGFEGAFGLHGWPAQWRGGIYDFHHYHSNAHEVLGVVSGSAWLMLGGPGGRLVRFKAGDVVVLPAGTGHRRVEASDDFVVVGAYPPGQRWNLCRESDGPPAEAVLARIARVPFPSSDPVYGDEGPLIALWRHG
ncbi:Uncharacterized protein YjlB [Verrucomicrobium sp. GAS474]|uniref:cupin domain-containing protein n=1 Tax=Verrucomicrobium sp. GAS474 TaxID=1882831 RepID=UPI00087B4113|nr:cupin domain-containing protein [Verrucomicrobium sp. GAS474]SDT91834.1 Uncharacterized protein YjlB [Verrucomicrobium sp. GAS474]